MMTFLQVALGVLCIAAAIGILWRVGYAAVNYKSHVALLKAKSEQEKYIAFEMTGKLMEKMMGAHIAQHADIVAAADAARGLVSEPPK